MTDLADHETHLLAEAADEIVRLRDKLARLERNWDLRADAIRRTQKLHRAEVKELRAEIKRLKA
jgi:predicted  nucleic acid-binding Zn-ribbon protein